MYLFILGYIWLGNATLLVKWLTANEIFQPTSPKMLHGEIKTSFLHFSSCHMLLPRAVRTRVMIFFLLFTLKTITSFCRHYMDPIISVGLDGTDSSPHQRCCSQPPATTAHLFASRVSQRCGRAKAGGAANNLMTRCVSGLSCPSPSLAEQLSFSDSFNLQYWHAEEEIMHTSCSLFVFPCCSSHPVWGHMV